MSLLSVRWHFGKYGYHFNVKKNGFRKPSLFQFEIFLKNWKLSHFAYSPLPDTSLSLSLSSYCVYHVRYEWADCRSPFPTKQKPERGGRGEYVVHVDMCWQGEISILRTLASMRLVMAWWCRLRSLVLSFSFSLSLYILITAGIGGDRRRHKAPRTVGLRVGFRMGVRVS